LLAASVSSFTFIIVRISASRLKLGRL